jgi:TonB-dependent receptor
VRADNIDFPNLRWEARDSAGAVIDPYNLNNYRLNTLQNSPVDGKAKMEGAFANLDRDFNIGGFPLTVKVGAATRKEDRDNRRYTEQWNFIGRDGIANTADDSAGPFLDREYSREDPYFGSPPIQWVNPYTLADLFRSNPEQFRGTTSTITVDGTSVTTEPGYPAELARISNSQKVTERVSAGFLQFNGKLFNNRLQFTTGARYEKTEDKGEGALVDPDAVFQRNASGGFIRDAAGRRVLRPEAGAAGSLAFLRLTNVERGYKAQREYDGVYPSVHLTFNITDNLLARFAYAKTLGRPDYTDIIPTANFDDNEAADLDPTVSPGTITVSNTALKPWTADNYDLSLEYYFARSGVASVGIFQKDLKDFWANVTGPLTPALASQVGIDANQYAGWITTTKINAGQAKISGAEFNFEQQLRFNFLPEWARNFRVSANGTMLHLEGPNGADFARFTPKAGNLSLSWNKRPISARVNFNYRGRQRNLAQTGAQYGATNNFYEYYDSRYNIDVNVEYTLSRRFKLFGNARNILNTPQVLERYSHNSALYASGFRHEEFGVQYALGVKGTF